MGVLTATPSVVSRHLGTAAHRASVRGHESRQQRIDDTRGGVGVGGPAVIERSILAETKEKLCKKVVLGGGRRDQRESRRDCRRGLKNSRPGTLFHSSFLPPLLPISAALVVGALACGGGSGGAAGIPPHSVPKLLNQSILGLPQDLPNGLPSGPTIAKVTLPDAHKLVKEHITSRLKGASNLVFTIDGGSAYNLVLGRKIIVILCGGHSAGAEFVLDVRVIEGHEDSELQAQIVEELRIEYGVKKSNIRWLR